MKTTPPTSTSARGPIVALFLGIGLLCSGAASAAQPSHGKKAPGGASAPNSVTADAVKVPGIIKAPESGGKGSSQSGTTLNLPDGDVYEVRGQAGAFCATKANGKKVEITGAIGESNGKKTITARASGVKIIVIDNPPGVGYVPDLKIYVGLLAAAGADAPEAATLRAGALAYKLTKDANGKTVAAEAKGKKVEIFGILEDKDGVKFLSVSSCKIIE